MPRSRASTPAAPQSTSQQLGSLIKSARDIMRKDKGLSGDLDRLPMLTWIMFLKFLDDMEQIREQEAVLAGRTFRPTIESPYRWRDWAADEEGITGDELTAFINQDDAVRPDGKRGVGLFAYLRGLQSENGRDRRDVVANVFRGVVNRMVNGYLVRDVINKVNGIHFASSDEIHTLGALYESMLREMRDAAGDSGEFYTPRPVVRFMVEVVDPRLGETILDPACGTGGFLVEAFNHLSRQCQTVEDRQVLQERSIYGQEAKPLPYMLSQMNLLLHGLEYPHIEYGNSLAVKVSEIGDKDRVDIILTNPPFGGEEESGLRTTSPPTCRPPRQPCSFYNSSCVRSAACRKPAAPLLSRPTARSSPTAWRPGSRRYSSRSSTSTLLSACLTVSSRLTRTSPRMFSSSTAPGQRRTSGTMSTPCPKAGRTTPRPNRFSTRSSARSSLGGNTEKRTSGRGEFRRSNS